MSFNENVIHELFTIRDFLRWTTSCFNEAQLFYGHGTDNAWDEAVALILNCLHLPGDMNNIILDARITETEKKAILHLLKRRIEARVPLPYLTNEAWFAGFSFYVDERVLIPRSPFAEWIENKFEPWIEAEKVNRILDLCTGSACIAIACAHYFPETEIVASDISRDALFVAEKNVVAHQLQNQITLCESDLLANIEGKFDIIICNPPYVSESEYNQLPAEYLHEPRMALTTKEDGLILVDAILKSAARHLTEHGILFLEVGYSANAFIERYPELLVTTLTCQRGGEGMFLITKAAIESQFSK